jgi:transcriptional regulator with XRE-family HTH domain
MDIYFKRIGEARKKAGLSKSEMARTLGVTPQTYQRYESTRMPGADILAGMAKVLNISVDWLLGIVEDYESTSSTPNSCRECYLKDLKIKILNLKIDSLEIEKEYLRASNDEALKIINNVKPEYN